MKLVMFALFALSLFGQAPKLPTHFVYKATSLSGAAEKVTVQQVTGGNSASVRFTTATVYCSVACTVYIGQNVSAATTTTLAISSYNAAPPSRSAAFSSSNGGSITAKPSFTVAAGQTWTFDLSMFLLARNSGSANNLSIGTSSITGDVTIQINWTED